LVVIYSKDDPKVRLSLRQADILAALASDAELAKDGGCVPELQDVAAGDRFVSAPVFPSFKEKKVIPC
jgi:glutamate--cysteine ligase catalytic subunit